MNIIMVKRTYRIKYLIWYIALYTYECTDRRGSITDIKLELNKYTIYTNIQSMYIFIIDIVMVKLLLSYS